MRVETKEIQPDQTNSSPGAQLHLPPPDMSPHASCTSLDFHLPGHRREQTFLERSGAVSQKFVLDENAVLSDYRRRLSDREIAQRHGCGRSTIRRWREKNHLPAHEISQLSTKRTKHGRPNPILCESCWFYRGTHIKTCDFILVNGISRGCPPPQTPEDDCCGYRDRSSTSA